MQPVQRAIRWSVVKIDLFEVFIRYLAQLGVPVPRGLRGRWGCLCRAARKRGQAKQHENCLIQMQAILFSAENAARILTAVVLHRYRSFLARRQHIQQIPQFV
jgi:hypothetical protein